MRVNNWGFGVTDVNEDYHLKTTSNCIDAGDPNGNYDSQLDFDGECRVVGSAINIGADEEHDCFPTNNFAYNDWVTFGKPQCWCANPCGSGYQCDGDADGSIESQYRYRVYYIDLDIVQANWKKKINDPTLNPCADIDHKSSGAPYYYRVYTNDLNRVVANWKKTDNQLPCDCPRSQ